MILHVQNSSHTLSNHAPLLSIIIVIPTISIACGAYNCYLPEQMLTMLFKSIIFLLLSVHCCGAVPVVGILSQPRSSGNETYHYIAASYVKWIESSGAIAIPIPYDADETLTKEIFSQINGVLFPGGDALLPLSAKVMWELALESNKCGEYFPVWGTCLGFGKFHQTY